MKKLTIILILTATICQAQLIQEEYTQFGLWTDPVAMSKESGPQFGIEIQKIMLWGWVGASLSHFEALEPNYTDLVASGGINFYILNYDPVRYYAGPRMGFLFRDGNGYPLVGGVMGFDWRLSRKHSNNNFHIGLRAYIDYREDQKNQFYGDSDAYQRGLITNNPLLQENGAIVISWSWD